MNKRNKHRYLNGSSSKGSNSSGKTKNISIENVNNASDSEAAPKKVTSRKKKKKKKNSKKTPVQQNCTELYPTAVHLYLYSTVKTSREVALRCDIPKHSYE